MMNDIKVVALLPMKEHSERVPNKNFKDFCGKPLFRWVLDLLLDNRSIDQIVINTDADILLSDQALNDNPRIILRERPADIRGDYVSMNEVIADDVSAIESDVYLMTHTTNPLLKAETIGRALDLFVTGKAEGYDSVFTVNKIQTRFYDYQCQAINHDPNNLIRTQDLEPYYEENSNLYVFSSDSFAKSKARIGVKPQFLVTEPMESTDIDTPDDWDLAEVLVEFYRKKGVVV